MDTSDSGAKTVAFVPEKKSKTALSTETRKITVPQNRVRPLKTNWKKIFDPIVEMLGLQIRCVHYLLSFTCSPKLSPNFMHTILGTTSKRDRWRFGRLHPPQPPVPSPKPSRVGTRLPRCKRRLILFGPSSADLRSMMPLPSCDSTTFSWTLFRYDAF